MTREQMQNMERRGEERIPVLQPKTKLSHRECETEVPVMIIDVTFWNVFEIR